MELILALLIGFVLGLVAMAMCVRRARKHPRGKTAKFVNATTGGGGGGNPGEPL